MTDSSEDEESTVLALVGPADGVRIKDAFGSGVVSMPQGLV